MSAETKEDILAEIRDAMTRVGFFFSESVAEWCDRFEAAFKRESVGNAAAMREALVFCLRIIGKNGIRGNVFIDDIREAHRVITAAIAEPARNCDIQFVDDVARYGAFKDWCNAKGNTMEPKLAYDAFQWLLSPAEKGGAE